MLGMWQQVIKSDQAADDMTMSYTARVNPQAPANSGRNAGRYHSLDFLANAYLQLAQDEKAKAIFDARNSFGDAEFPATVRYSMHTAYAAIPVRYTFERGAWAEAAALPVARTIYPQAEAMSWFGRAIGAARSGNVAAAKEAATQLRPLKEKLAKADDGYWAGQVEIQELCRGGVDRPARRPQGRRDRGDARRRRSRGRQRASTSRWRTGSRRCASCWASSSSRRASRPRRSRSSRHRYAAIRTATVPSPVPRRRPSRRATVPKPGRTTRS